MTQELPATRSLKPASASVRTFEVVEARTVSPSFRRVTLGSLGDGFEQEFDYLGHDHWFRLFFAAADRELVLPFGGADGWYSRLLAMPDETRPIVRNYTIRDARRDGERWLLDVDFVLHAGQSGDVEGEAARWCLRARPGDRVGLLDQGRIHRGAEHDGPLVIVADETGLPGVEGIARSLAAEAGDGSGARRAVRCIVEIGDADDRRELPGFDVEWALRDGHAAVGSAALETLRSAAVDPGSAAYIVGEGSATLAARAHLLESGVPKDRIDFCAYWRR
ncbi:siderophore-interacting protein [Microbacterium marinilacus]|uniref:Siderophore-interacting protein n=1 Tax=Microbacterium marinilacus TaxID=415209 RepID=A0ABP7BC33_9MICO|nr:siderophore-interacting protein [Microbacterium marinilacus]MBY0689413.1 siderophore-interacting protein [Microbacterium marinilacus]